MVDFVQVSHGRRLAFQQEGAQDGHPLFLLHGTPGSRLAPRPRSSLLRRLNIRLITYDRPGYGESDRQPDRTVADCAADVALLADHLDVRRFAVAGRSGGGPHALACAALLGDRVTRCAALVALAPRLAEGLDWLAGMTASNVREYLAAANGRPHLAQSLTPAADGIRADPVRLIESLYHELPIADRQVVSDIGIRAQLEVNYAEALKNSADGWIDDLLAFIAPWGFDPGRITVPTFLWHGTEDVFSPIGHSLWLARHIPTALLSVRPGAAHFDALDALPRILPWLIGSGDPALN
ncbi:alpha/beta hydrolase [Acrocarpospora phusangensis]|uniref:Alpha/beta hydrolase n=1 Tax=Acrocarpospora phusangensis TaxID=1070424 RepID=A0A919Q668_9ACTN|nr:alpha/beta hydrolase [Acrocarpospora phusangensis]GIH23144.1 alpha/beta hydrolase [Acrocarpospora phusangensis]